MAAKVLRIGPTQFFACIPDRSVMLITSPSMLHRPLDGCRQVKCGAPGEIRTPDPLVRSQRYRYCTVDSKGLYRVGRGTKGTEITLIGALLVLTFYPRHHNPSVEKAKKRPTEGGLSRWLIVSLHTCEFRLRRPSCIDPFLVSVDRTLHSLRDRLRVDSRGGVR